MCDVGMYCLRMHACIYGKSVKPCIPVRTLKITKVVPHGEGAEGMQLGSVTYQKWYLKDFISYAGC